MCLRTREIVDEIYKIARCVSTSVTVSSNPILWIKTAAWQRHSDTKMLYTVKYHEAREQFMLKQYACPSCCAKTKVGKVDVRRAIELTGQKKLLEEVLAARYARSGSHPATTRTPSRPFPD